MNLSELINEILVEWAYRVDNGQPNPKNEKHLAQLSIVLSEMGLSHIKAELFENITEADKNFKSAILNKEIPYKAADGTQKKGIVGNLLRLPKDSPGRVAAEKLMPPEGSEERDSAMQDLGSEKDGKSTGGDKEKGKEDEKPKDGEQPQGGGEEEKAKATQAMFDPKVDPAMAVRLDKEKEMNAKLADTSKSNDTSKKEKEEEPNPLDAKFNPINTQDVAKEMPEADPETFNGDSDIPDGIDPKDLEKFNTDISKVKQIVDDAKAKGEKAPNINLCQITVPGTNLYCDDNLGIPRDEMPQFKGKPQPGTPAADMPVDEKGDVDTEPLFKKMLEDKGIKVVQTEVPSDKLKATQSELVGAKVVGMMSALEENPNNEGITAPIYVSRDGFVVDGHHRWAAIAAYNAAHPDAQIPMKVQVIDMDIKDAIPMCNKFAEEQGVAAKKADANKEDAIQPAQLEPANNDTESKAKKFKGATSGKEIQTIEIEGGGQVYGTVHKNTAMVDDIVNQVKNSIPKEKWKDIVFVGEGGATNNSGELEFNDEMVHANDKFKEMGASIDTFDGDDLDVHKPDSKLYKKQIEKTGLSQSQVNAGNWASMIGQGEGTDTMKPTTFLDEGGKQFLQDAAKEAGFAPIENWDNPTDKDIDTLYRLSFPDDLGDKETKVNDIQIAFNDIRDESIIEKSKALSAQGKIPITVAGEGHIDLVDKKMKKSTEKLPEPQEPSKEDGGVIYNVGGNYYSDSPDGPAQYVKTESVVEKVLIEGDETWAYLLFEATVTKRTSGGNTVKVKTIPPKNQKKATVVAKAKEKKETKPTQSTGATKTTPAKKTKKFVATPEDKARLKYRKEELAKIVASGLIPTQKKKLSGAGVFVPTEKQMQSLLEVTKKQIEDPEYRLPLPKYDVSEEDIDIAIETMKEILRNEFSSVFNSIKKAGGVDSKLTTREAGNQRVRDIIKKYLETGGRSAITGEFVPFNQMQLDHHVPYSSAAQRVADKKKKGIKTTLLEEQDELDSPENWDLMETPLNQLKNSLEGNALIERINKKLSASPDEKEKKKLETELKNIRRRALLTSLVTSFGNGDYSGINEETLEQFNQDEMNIICKAWNWYHPNTKDADQFREIDPEYDAKLKERGIDTSVRHPLSITRGVTQQGGARGRGQIKQVGELRKSFLAVVRQAGIKLMTKKDVKKTDLALARAVKDVETATKPQTDKINQLKQKIKQQTAQSKK